MVEYRRSLVSAPNAEPPLRDYGARAEVCQRPDPSPPRRLPLRADPIASRRRTRRPQPASAGEAHLLARRFADRSLRVVLEVLDRRRPFIQLSAVANESVVSAMRTLVTSDLVPGQALGVAGLVRLDVAMVDATTAEACAGYERGNRRFALAARLVRTRAKGWQLTVLRIN